MKQQFNSQPDGITNPAENDSNVPANDDKGVDNEDEYINSQSTTILVTEAESEKERTTVEINAKATEANSEAQTTTAEANVPTTAAQIQTTTAKASKEGKGEK